jgi:hypothetical protein
MSEVPSRSATKRTSVRAMTALEKACAGDCRQKALQEAYDSGVRDAIAAIVAWLRRYPQNRPAMNYADAIERLDWRST